MADFIILYDADNDDIPELDISAAVTSDITGEYGDFGVSSVSFLSGVGTARFELNNESGAYTSLAIGRRVDIKVSDGVYEKLVFSGKISPAKIDPREWGDQKVHVMLEDWMKIANSNKVKNLQVQQDITADVALGLLLDTLARPPAYTDFEVGTETFPEVFDGVGKSSSVYSEMDRIAKSELAPMFLRFRDTDSGETLRFENQLSRGLLAPLSVIPVNDADVGFMKYHGAAGASGYIKYHGAGGASGRIKISAVQEAVFDRLHSDAVWQRGDYLVNKFTASDVSRTFDASPVNLFEFIGRGDQLLNIGSSITAILGGGFTNPNDRGTYITGKDIITPVATTDYIFNTEIDGSGVDVTANIEILSFSYAAHRWDATIKNLGPDAHCLRWCIRGTGIYKDATTDYIVENADSIEDVVKEERNETIKREYSSNRYTSKTFADGVVALNRLPQNSMRSATFEVSTEFLLRAFMFLDLGGKVRSLEGKPAKDGKYYIQGIRFVLRLGGTISFTYSWEEDVETLTQPIIVRAPLSEQRSAIDFGVLPYLANLNQFSYSLWINRVNPLSGPFGPLIARSVDEGSGRKGNYFLINSESLTFISHKTPTDGQWDTGNIITDTNTWHHVVLTYDNTNDAANPEIWLDGVSVSVTETAAPSGTSDDDSACPLILFNLSPDPAVPTQKYYYDTIHDFAMKDVRIYGKVLSAAEIAELFAGEDDYTTVPDGLLFQGIYAHKENIDEYVDQTITDQDPVLDAVHKATGTPYNENTFSDNNMLYGQEI